MERWIQNHIRRNELITNDDKELWVNGYYDNQGCPVEGGEPGNIRMMLPSQVFSIMPRTITDDQIPRLVKSIDVHLYDSQLGGYRLNTNFQETKLDLGRAFGFAYGHKENGAGDVSLSHRRGKLAGIDGYNSDVWSEGG